MRSLGLIAAISLLFTGCGSREEAPEAPEANDGAQARASPTEPVSTPDMPEDPAPNTPGAPAPRWDLQSSGEGVALALVSASGGTVMRLFCPAGAKRLLLNVPRFRPVGSEERLSFGGEGDVAALVADPRGDAQRGGISGTGAVPDDLADLIDDPISASYGAQTSGPHSAPPPNLSGAFVTACREASAPAAALTAASAGACLMQDGERLAVKPLRAVGTEPFWGARIEGRCVTYSHPEDQKGTRIWTRFTPRSDGNTWSGALGGRRFELRTRAAPGCSDGMSDRRYPMAVELLVNSEKRTGCAEPL